MTDYRNLLERDLARVGPAPFDFDDVARRRDRKRRDQRIVAGVVGTAVFVASVWFVTGSLFERTQTPALPGPTAATGPSVPDPDGGGLLGLPPEGAEPSSPERGELVVTFYGRPASTTVFHTGVLQVLVYADGRVIWRREGGPTGADGITTGFLEQRLTPEGVELLRAEVISSGLFDRNRELGVEWSSFSPSVEGLKWGGIRIDRGDRFVSVGWSGWRRGFWNEVDATVTPATAEQATALRRLNDLFSGLASMLPSTAWEETEVEAYVPSKYAICYVGRGDGSRPPRELEPSEVLNLLPTRAEDLLLGRDRTYEPSEGWDPQQICSEVTTGEARLLVEILIDARVQRHPTTLTTGALEYAVPAPAPTERVYIRFEPILPHGQWSLFPG